MQTFLGDFILFYFASVRSIVSAHSLLYSSGVLQLRTEFERMWILCNRYLTVAIEFGPELTGALFRLELLQELDVLDATHKVDEWMTQLTANCQKSGVILSPEPAEAIAPIGVDIAYYTTYEWCKKSGAFPLRQTVRRRAEAVYNVAPEYRMSAEELDRL